MNRALLALTTLISSFSLSGCLEEAERVENHGFAGPIERVEVRTGAGDIEVHGDPSATQASVRAEVYGEATEVVARLEGGLLDLHHRCPKRSRACAVEWTVVLPAGQEARIFEASTGSGDIDFFDTHGLIVAETGSGDIGLHDVVATELDLETGSGDIGARVRGELETVRAETGSGDVELLLPKGAYHLDVDTGSGDVSTRDISDDSSSARTIDVRTGSGDVELRGE